MFFVKFYILYNKLFCCMWWWRFSSYSFLYFQILLKNTCNQYIQLFILNISILFIKKIFHHSYISSKYRFDRTEILRQCGTLSITLGSFSMPYLRTHHQIHNIIMCLWKKSEITLEIRTWERARVREIVKRVLDRRYGDGEPRTTDRIGKWCMNDGLG